MYSCKTYEELENIVNAWLNGDEDTSQGTSRGPTESSNTESTTTTSSSTKEGSQYKSLEEAFADLEDI